MATLPAAVRDLKRGPIFFRTKKWAIKARGEAKDYGLKVRLSKTTWGWKLSKA